MSSSHPPSPSAVSARRLFRRVAVVACLALPLALLHARAVAEVLIGLVDVLFLAECALASRAGVATVRTASWARRPFVAAALLWWAWLVACSVLGTGGTLHAVLAVRLPVLTLALDAWLLAGDAGERTRRALWLVLAAALAWIGLECWQQYVFGTNLFGRGRWGDGALTGPFGKPRAGPAFILLFFPVLVPLCTTLLTRDGRGARVAGVGLAMLGALTMVLIGQRMPTLLMLFGLAAAALLVPRLRLAALCAALAGAAMVIALPWVSPAAAAKLVQQTRDQMAHFALSDYGLIFTRALALAQLHPWLGEGFDAFRRGCADPAAMHGVAWLGIPTAGGNGGLAACNLHPHNYYLEALDNAGLPGLVLFCAMVGTAFQSLARRPGAVPAGMAWRGSPAMRAGLTVGALVALWPFASTSAFTSMPNGGWVFLLLGLGFAQNPHATRPRGAAGVRERPLPPAVLAHTADRARR